MGPRRIEAILTRVRGLTMSPQVGVSDDRPQGDKRLHLLTRISCLTKIDPRHTPLDNRTNPTRRRQFAILSLHVQTVQYNNKLLHNACACQPPQSGPTQKRARRYTGYNGSSINLYFLLSNFSFSIRYPTQSIPSGIQSGGQPATSSTSRRSSF